MNENTNRSVWQDEAGVRNATSHETAKATTHPDELPAHADVCIVGAGLAGLSIAYHLLKKNAELSVVLLEARTLGEGASGRTTGMVTPGIGQNFAGLVKRIGVQSATEAYRGTRAAIAYVGEVIATENIECEHEHNGQLIIAHGEDGESRLCIQADALEYAGQPCTRLSMDALAQRVQLETNPKSRSLAAIYLPDAATLHPLKLLKGFAGAVQKRGAKIICNAKVVRIESQDSPVILRLDNGQTIRAGKVVFATAAESTALTNLTGRIIPVNLSVIATGPLSPEQLTQVAWRGRECIIDSRRLFNYFRLTPDNRIVFGGGVPRYYRSCYSAVSTADFFQGIEQEFRNTFSRLGTIPIQQKWTGTIDYTIDGLPTIGPVSHQSNVIYAGGFCGHGIALSIQYGQSIAEMVVNSSDSTLFPWLRQKAMLIPGEWLRRTSFSIASTWMRLRDAH